MNIAMLAPEGVDVNAALGDLADSPEAFKLHVFHQVTSLAAFLGAFFEKPLLLVLFILDRPTLALLLSMKHLLADTQLVLVLANDDKTLVAAGHQLQPRVILYTNSVSTQLAPLIERIVRRSAV